MNACCPACPPAPNDDEAWASTPYDDADAYGLARMGNGAAVHLTDADGVLCNRWGTVNGRWVAPSPVEGTPDDATCRRCQKIAEATP